MHQCQQSVINIGPIIRINPYEIHINDPYFYDELYVTGSKGKTDKWAWSVRNTYDADGISTYCI